MIKQSQSHWKQFVKNIKNGKGLYTEIFLFQVQKGIVPKTTPTSSKEQKKNSWK